MDAITQQIQHFDLLRSRFNISRHFIKPRSSNRDQSTSMGSMGPDVCHLQDYNNPINNKDGSSRESKTTHPSLLLPPPPPPPLQPVECDQARDESKPANANTADSSSPGPMYLDALVVGAGWGGISSLNALRQAGFTNVKLVDANPDAGGVWTYTIYPGCRNDVPVPMYQFTSECTWKDWTWENRYPYQHEMTAYLRHACEKLDVYRDFIPNTRISAAIWDEDSKRWSVYAKGGLLASTKYLFAATGDVTKKHIPRSLELRGLSTFKNSFHTSEWPRDVRIQDLSQKRVGIIGTGASGMQIIEAIGPHVAELTVFQRTPNMAMPRRREDKAFTKELQDEEKKKYPELFAYCDTTATGLDTDWGEFPVSDSEATERYLEAKWDRGDFWFGNHVKMLQDRQINDIVYNFWRKKVTSRIKDEWMREKLAPKTPVHAFGTKRPSHESYYFEIFNQSNVHLVDIRENPISRITPGGILTEDGEFHGLDYLVLATGFDYNIGSILAIDVRGRNGLKLNQKWASSTKTSIPSSSSSFTSASTSFSRSTSSTISSHSSSNSSSSFTPVERKPVTIMTDGINHAHDYEPHDIYTFSSTYIDGPSHKASTTTTTTTTTTNNIFQNNSNINNNNDNDKEHDRTTTVTTHGKTFSDNEENHETPNNRHDNDGCSKNDNNGEHSYNYDDDEVDDDSGIWTHLGLTTHGFPNFFFPDGPQAPSAFGVTPRLTEHQGTFLAALLNHTQASGAATVEPKPEAEVTWRNVIEENTPSLLKEADSWYMGVNIPGRIRQPLCFYGGCQTYRKYLEGEVKAGFPNFDFQSL